MGCIESRRSIRKFKQRKVERSSIEEILEAGLQAPSPKNRQPWRFKVITNENMKKELTALMEREILERLHEKPERKDICASLETMKVISKAPVLILVCYKYGMEEYHEDGVDWQISAKDLEAVELQAIGAAVENMLLKAEELGIGSLWCADILYAYKTLSRYSELPVISAVCLGYADESPKSRKRGTKVELCEFY